MAELVKGPIELGSAQRQESIQALGSPSHASLSLLETGRDDALASSLSDAAVEVHTLCAKSGIAHAQCPGAHIEQPGRCISTTKMSHRCLRLGITQWARVG
jgi:hypothetical protein